ncbi:hypothetical protein WG908_13025 [Sphingobium sp. AN641]|uniref:hypothetical protein n=1 Tax=Sphingobium sp. AN641 TaxID=3133443 RepID=UPI0030C45FCC
MSDAIAPHGALTRLLLAHGDAAGRTRRALAWAYDERLADIIRTTSDPMIGRIRIAWWDEALADPARAKGRGEPLLDALRAAGMAGDAGLRAMLDGWEALLVPQVDADAMRDFAIGRGGGLFTLLSGVDDPPSWLWDAGRLWALWDLSGHLHSAPARAEAVALAGRLVPALKDARWPAAWKSMRIATALARHDIIRNRPAPPALTPGLYARLLGLLIRPR